MKAAVFTVQYAKGKNGEALPSQFRTNRRIALFADLARCARDQNADLAVLPGGFFRHDWPAGIARALKANPPRIMVLVGHDNESCDGREVWVVSPAGSIRKKLPEAWEKPGQYNEKVLERITDRCFWLKGEKYAVFSCGDVLIDERRAPITGARAAFVLTHYSARRFTAAMRRKRIPTFLAQHTVYPQHPQAMDYACQGASGGVDPVARIKGETGGTKWLARIYKV